MKKYTQRELHNEAFRDMLRGIKNVAKAGIKGAAKNVAKYISPELYGMAKAAKEIYSGGNPNTVLKDYLLKTRAVPIFLKSPAGGVAVTEQEIIDGSAEPTFRDTFTYDPTDTTKRLAIKPNSIKARLELVKIGKPQNKNDGIFAIPFEAKSKGVEGSYIAYIDKIDKDRHQIIGIMEAP
jgi:hypothetical protein